MKFRLEIEKPDRSCIGCEFYEPPREDSNWQRCFFGNYESNIQTVNQDCPFDEVQDE